MSYMPTSSLVPFLHLWCTSAGKDYVAVAPAYKASVRTWRSWELKLSNHPKIHQACHWLLLQSKWWGLLFLLAFCQTSHPWFSVLQPPWKSDAKSKGEEKVTDAKIASIQHVYLPIGWMKKLLALFWIHWPGQYTYIACQWREGLILKRGWNRLAIVLWLFLNHSSYSPPYFCETTAEAAWHFQSDCQKPFL